MKAEIISTGTELLLGNIADTNTAFLAEQLARLGIDLYYAATVGDNYDRLLGTLKLAWGRSDLILMTGGLGPTQGDITRDVIAGLFEEKMEIDPGLKVALEKFFSERSIAMSANNLKQATLIPSAQAIPNSRGTAPGWWAEKDGKVIIAMPGPPTEMQTMWQKHVEPALQGRTGGVILSRTLKIFGMPEGSVDEALSPLLKSNNPTLAIYAKQDGIHLRITAKASTKEAARNMIASHEKAVTGVVGKYLWGTDDDELGTMVGQMLIAKGLTVAVAESFTSGSLIKILADTPKSSQFFKGGFYTTSDEAKISLGLVWGAGDMMKTTNLMAALARDKMQASIGMAIEGYAEKADDNPTVKVFIAIAGAKYGQSLTLTYPGRMTNLGSRIAYSALFELKKFLSQ
jgi:nicotinamide-nucleotide amidase